MVIRFTWRTEEWREAYLLTTSAPPRPSGPIGIPYLVLGIMVLGGAGHVLRKLWYQQRGLLLGRLVPAAFVVAALVAVVLTGLQRLRDGRRYRGLPIKPRGEQEFVLHELGWKTATGADAGSPVRAWSELRGQRTGHHVLALLTESGETVGVPLRVLSAEQGGWVRRMLTRKIPSIAT